MGVCQEINQSDVFTILKYLLIDKPNFLLKKFRSLENEKIIQSIKNPSKKGKTVIDYLKHFLPCQKVKETLTDVPCYTNSTVQNDFRKRIKASCTNRETDNPNAPDRDGTTPISWAALWTFRHYQNLGPFDRQS